MEYCKVVAVDFFRWGLRYCGVVAVDCTHLTVTSQTRTGNSYQLGQTLLLVSTADDNILLDMDKDRVNVIIHEHQHCVLVVEVQNRQSWPNYHISHRVFHHKLDF